METEFISAHREFAFAPWVVTICARSPEALQEALDDREIPVIRTQLDSLPYGTYLPAGKLLDLTSGHLMHPGFSDEPISKETPDIWMIGFTEDERVRGLAPVSARRAPAVITEFERQGQTVFAYPIPKGAIN